MYYSLDIRTLSLASAVVNLILCFCMLHVYHRRKVYPGFKQWTLASVLYCLGMGFMSLRAVLPDFITIVIANSLFSAGAGLIAYGIQLFTGSTKRKSLFIAITAITMLTFIYYTYFSTSTNARIVIISIVLAVLSGYSGYIIYHYIPSATNGRNLLLTYVFSIQAVWFGFRIFPTVFLEGPIADFMQASAFHGVSFLVSFIANMFIVIGLIVLNFQRIEGDLLHSLEEIKRLKGIIPICAYCKKIRDDEGYWSQIEEYIREHSEAEFTHGICPECTKKLYLDSKRGNGQQ